MGRSPLCEVVLVDAQGITQDGDKSDIVVAPCKYFTCSASLVLLLGQRMNTWTFVLTQTNVYPDKLPSDNCLPYPDYLD